MARVKYDFDDLQADLMPHLDKILAKRLLLNRTWNNVKVVTGKKNMKIVWFDAKNPTDHSKIRDITPFDPHTLYQQCEIQYGKLQRDIKNAYG